MKDNQFLEEEIELLRRDNAQIKERLSKLEKNIEIFSNSKHISQTKMESPIESGEFVQEKIEKSEIKSDFYTQPSMIKNEKMEETAERVPQKSDNSGIILMIVGLLLCFTGVGIILGLPLLIAGIYNYAKSRKSDLITAEKKDYLDDLNMNKNAPFSVETKINSEGEIKNIPAVQEINFIKKNTSFEEEVGIKWFARIGILALVVGIGFFIKYAIDLGWINHLARIIMGVSLGIGLVIYGEIISKKENYIVWAKTLTGGGSAIIYFVIYGAYHFVSYREAIGMNQILDIFLLIMVSAVSVGLSIKDNSKIIAAEAFFLGYVTALLSSDFETISIIYASLLTVGLVTVVAYKQWSAIGLFGVFASYFLYALWHNDGNNSFIFSSFILLFYFSAFSLQSFFISRNKELSVDNILITLVNSGLFFLLAFGNVHKFYPDWDSGVALFLAVFHLIGFGLYKNNEVKNFSAFNLYLALLFITLFIPIYFSERLITIIWALETVLLAALYIKTKNNVLKVAFNILGLLVFLKNIFFDSFTLNSFNADNFIDSTRLMSFLASIISFYLIYVLIKRHKEIVPHFDFSLLPIYTWISAFLAVLIIFMEMASDYPAWTSVLLAVLVFIYMAIGSNSERKEFFYQAVTVSVILFLKLLFFDVFSLKAFDAQNIFGSTRLWTFAFVIWVFYLLYIYLKTLAQSDKIIRYVAKVYSWLAFIFLILISLMEFGKDYSVWVSLFLGFLSLVYIFISKLSVRELFYQGAVVSIIVSLKVLITDSIVLKSLEDGGSLTDSRILPFLTVIAMGYLLSHYLSKNSLKLAEAERVLVNFYSYLGTFFAFILIILELKEYWISVGWIFLALILTIIGFMFNKKYLRMQGIIILFISIFKVFVYDIRELEVIYRTISYIVLGIILLLISFIYTKYKDKIKEIIIE